jgi:rubredoxin/uncharacterized membrane protein
MWECGVCGYIHKEGDPPEKCPVCEAPKTMFKESADKGTAAVAVRRWRCSVCGYIHSGDEPPQPCPVCAADRSQFVEIDADGNRIAGEDTAVPSVVAVVGSGANPSKPSPAGRKTMLERVAGLVLSLHLHPITVHFPNGILPAVLVFLGTGVYFNIAALEIAAYYNLIFVLIMLPVVLATGFIEWRLRYNGAKTFVFITKIFCALVVLAATNILVFWRLIDPAVLAAESPYRLIYLGVAAGLLGAAGIAGHLGGKLVFGSRG